MRSPARVALTVELACALFIAALATAQQPTRPPLVGLLPLGSAFK